MPRLSWCIVIYGLVLIASDLLDRTTPLNLALGEMAVPCWSGGAIIIAAGLASAQGRRSLRLTGLYIATLLPLLLAGFFGWQSVRRLQSTPIDQRAWMPIAMTSILSAISFGLLLCIIRLRPREGIASRGYSVPLPPLKKTIPGSPEHVQSKPIHSEAG